MALVLKEASEDPFRITRLRARREKMLANGRGYISCRIGLSFLEAKHVGDDVLDSDITEPKPS